MGGSPQQSSKITFIELVVGIAHNLLQPFSFIHYFIALIAFAFCSLHLKTDVKKGSGEFCIQPDPLIITDC
jgi:hypothetical protein